MFIAHFVPTIFYLFFSPFLVPRAEEDKKKAKEEEEKLAAQENETKVVDKNEIIKNYKDKTKKVVLCVAALTQFKRQKFLIDAVEKIGGD